jgi:glycosyltransferase involved in cell wall biosynthesis
MRHAGGAEIYFEQLRAGLAAAGDEVRLLTSSAGSAAGGTADAVAWGTESPAAQSVLQLANPWAWRQARGARRRFGPQLVFVGMFANHLSPAIFAAFRGLPVVFTATDCKVVCPTFAKVLPTGATCGAPEGRACLRSGCLSLPHWLREQPRYALIRRALGGARVLACSEFVRGELARNGIVSEHLPLPVDPAGPAFRRAPAAQPTFVFVGRLASQKGVLPLLRVFARLLREMPSARLRYVGDGPERDALADAARAPELGDAVTLVSWRPAARVEELLTDAWALVAPTRGPEPLGLVALEAIVRGVPVIATRNGGFVETVVEGRTGLLVADGDEAELLAAMRAVATRRLFPDHAPDAEVAERTAQRHSLPRHLAALRRLFAEEIAGRREAAHDESGHGLPA